MGGRRPKFTAAADYLYYVSRRRVDLNPKQGNKQKGQVRRGRISGTPACQMGSTIESRPPARDRASVAPVGQRLLSIAQASQYLSVSSWTVREMIWRGDLPCVQIGRRKCIDIHDLDQFIEQTKKREK